MSDSPRTLGLHRLRPNRLWTWLSDNPGVALEIELFANVVERPELELPPTLTFAHNPEGRPLHDPLGLRFPVLWRNDCQDRSEVGDERQEI